MRVQVVRNKMDARMTNRKGASSGSMSKPNPREVSSFYIYCSFEREVVPVERCRGCRRKKKCPQMNRRAVTKLFRTLADIVDVTDVKESDKRHVLRRCSREE